MEIKFDKKLLSDAIRSLEFYGFTSGKAKTALQNAFNRAGFETRNQFRDKEIAAVFKNPNQYTRNSIWFEMVKTNNDKMTGGVLSFKKKSTGGVGAGIYLMPQEWGGQRAFKGFELKLKRMGLLADNMFAVPTTAYPRELRNPSKLEKLANDIGKGVTRVAVGKRATAAKYNQYFVLKEHTGRLGPGIYLRSGRRKATRLFAYVDKVTYKQIFHFYDRAAKIFTSSFYAKLDDEIKKASGQP